MTTQADINNAVRDFCRKYGYEKLLAALNAAAEKQAAINEVEQSLVDMGAVPAAAEVGRTGQEASDHATSSLDWPVAEAGPMIIHQVVAENERLRLITIERCARAVYEHLRSSTELDYGECATAADAIRALKDEP